MTCCLGCHGINKGKSGGFIGARELLADIVCVCLKVLIVKSWADPKDWRPSGEGASSKGQMETVRRQ